MKITLLLLITFLAMCMNSRSQDLSSHQWEDRLILILTDDTSSKIFKKQKDELYSDREALQVRKLVIYTVLPNQFKRDDRKNQEWIQSDALYDKFKQSDRPFEILLIGLDGRVKMRQSEFLSNQDLFGRIDQMPMRRNEISNQKNE